MKIALVGVNPAYLQIFAGSDLKFSGYDDNGEPPICEIPNNNFFV
jgi:CTP synthase (UTP-ammonia lyase)